MIALKFRICMGTGGTVSKKPSFMLEMIRDQHEWEGLSVERIKTICELLVF